MKAQLNLSVLAPETLNLILAPLGPDLEKVEKRLRSVGEECEGVLKDSANYVLCGGGKRLRASLVLFCFSIPKSKKKIEKNKWSKDNSVVRARELATAVELLHSATLVHDDIVDRAVMRRLKPSVNVQFGDDLSVLLGDFLYARAFSMIANLNDRDIVSWMTGMTEDMCAGEIDQLKNRYTVDLGLNDYISFIKRKTAALISSCARCGAKLSGLPAAQISALASFGMNIGIAFQIVDDLLDLVGTETLVGKTLRTDAGNGKMTLPMILLLGQLNAKERGPVIKSLNSLHPDWSYIEGLLKKYQIAQETNRYANDYLNRALEAIREIDSGSRQSLESFSRFVLKRDF